jgi:hypothetical protein
MTTFIEEELSAAMREHVADVAISPDLAGRTVRAHRRRVRVTRSLYAGGAVALAAVIAAVVFAAPGRPPPTGSKPPQLELAAAARASRGTSYRITNTVTNRSLPGRPSFTVQGAFDPASTTGYVRTTSAAGGSSWHEERLVGGDLYTADVVDGNVIPWWHDPGTKHTSLSYVDKTGVPAVTADPEQLFDQLTRVGAAVRQTGPHTYHFDVAVAPGGGWSSGRVSAEVTVDPQGRIAKVVYEATLHGTGDPAGGTVLDGTLALSGYGRPVTVERPGGTFEDLPGKPRQPGQAS